MRRALGLRLSLPLVAMLTSCRAIWGFEDLTGNDATPPGAEASNDSGVIDGDGGARDDDAGAAESGDAGSDARLGPPPHCSGLPATCGPSVTDDCCASSIVSGGTFKRSYDAVDYTDAGNPASVSSFRLDKYEVTVGRFRKFSNAAIVGWRPGAGSGKHAHLAGGGLNVGVEPGWNVAWNSSLDRDAAQWTAYLQCPNPNGGKYTWISGNENLPINCIDWYVAYAFCIWDEGFLPTEAEWNYAAAGGDEQRAYPWSQPATSKTIDATYASYGGVQVSSVGSFQKGAGRWAHLDLAGSLEEWVLDWTTVTSYELNPCNDCAPFTATDSRVHRGGSWFNFAQYLLTSFRYDDTPSVRATWFGVRCARAP